MRTEFASFTRATHIREAGAHEGGSQTGHGAPLLSTAAKGHWRGLRKESRWAGVFNSCW